MILSQRVIVLLIVWGWSSTILSVSANPAFITGVQGKGKAFAVQKAVFSTEAPTSKKNAILHAPQLYPDTPVSVVDGSSAYSETDLSLPAFHLKIRRTYRSLPDRKGLFGPGWKLGYQVQLLTWDFDGTPAVAVERADGRIVIFQRRQSGFISPLGSLLKLTQNDDGGYLLTELGTREFTFNRHGQLTQIKYKNAKTLDMSYDANTNLLTEIRSGSQVVIRITYNAHGQIEALEDFTGRRYAYQYDDAKRLVQVTDPVQQNLRYQYDENGYMHAIIDRRGNVQNEINYTPAGKVKSYTRNGEKYRVQCLDETQTTLTNSQGHQWTYTYLPAGSITQTKDPHGNTVSQKYDKFLRLIQRTDKRGAITEFQYDDPARTRRIINPLGSLTTHIFKDKEWIIKQPSGHITTRRFNADDDLVEETVGTDEKVFYTDRYLYDTAGHLVQHIDRRGNATQFTYNDDGYLLKKVDVAGNVTRWQYNSLGHIVWEKDAADRITETSYDLLGRVSEINRTRSSTHEH